MAEIMKLDGTRQLDFDRETVEQAYDRWAPVYDLVFGGVFSKGRKAAIAATNKIGGRVLEVGVGTGISLPQYASHLRIVGVFQQLQRHLPQLRPGLDIHPLDSHSRQGGQRPTDHQVGLCQ